MKFFWYQGKTRFEDCRLIRKKVFVEEQGFCEEAEFDDIDDIAWHLLAIENGIPIAAARLFPKDNSLSSTITSRVYVAGRICVLSEYRGLHLGSALLSELERKAGELGAERIELGAQKRAVGFYEKSGYRISGKEYMDEFCPHVEMRKELG